MSSVYCVAPFCVSKAVYLIGSLGLNRRILPDSFTQILPLPGFSKGRLVNVVTLAAKEVATSYDPTIVTELLCRTLGLWEGTGASPDYFIDVTVTDDPDKTTLQSPGFSLELRFSDKIVCNGVAMDEVIGIEPIMSPDLDPVEVTDFAYDPPETFTKYII